METTLRRSEATAERIVTAQSSPIDENVESETTADTEPAWAVAFNSSASVYDHIDGELSSDRYVLMFFGDDDCFFSTVEREALKELRPGYSDEISFVELCTGDNPDLVDDFSVEGSPTVIIITGKIGDIYLFDTLRGFKDAAALEESLDSIVDAEGPIYISGMDLREGARLDLIVDSVLSTGRIAFLFLHADWCHFCNEEDTILDGLRGEYNDSVVFLGVEEGSKVQVPAGFEAHGYPTMYIVWGRSEAGYDYRRLTGFKGRDVLTAEIDLVLEGGSEISSLLDMISGCSASEASAWPHHTCDRTECVTDCLGENSDAFGTFLYDYLSYVFECAGCTMTVVSCCGALAACATVVGCLPAIAVCALCMSIAEVSPGPSCVGCATSFGNLADSAADLHRAMMECGSCCNDPMACEHGEQECKAEDPPDYGCTLSGFYRTRLTCQQCEWRVDEDFMEECTGGSHCVESASGAECQDDDDDEDDDPPDDDCTGEECSDDDGDGGGSGGGRRGGPSSGPGGDHPDDTFDISTLYTTTPSGDILVPELFVEKPDVAILERGYYLGLRELLLRMNDTGRRPEPSDFVDLDFSSDLIDEYPVLMIPSGGLFGLGSSTYFREKLEEYVSAGGTLIVLSQQHGYDYHALPGGEVDGYGWIEDQSCQYRSVGISTYHPIFSGFPPYDLNLYTDGYFTAWPENSTTLLTRTKNGQPAMLLYPYGDGWVVASSLYSDFIFVQGLYPHDEAKLYKNMLAWAKDPGPIPDYQPLDTVNIPINVANQMLSTPYQEYVKGGVLDLTVNVTNGGNQTSDGVMFLLLDPDFGLHVVNVSETITPGETRIVGFGFETTEDSPEGAWYVVYGLYNGSQTVWASGLAKAFMLDANVTAYSTYTVAFTLMEPSGAVATAYNVTEIVDPGVTQSVNFTYDLPSDALKMGIWSLDYVVRDHEGRIVDFGIEHFANSFYETYPDGWGYKGAELEFTITSDHERYLFGTPANFTFHLWNTGDADKNVTVTWGIHHNSYYGIVPMGIYDAFSSWIVVPASGYASFNYTLPAVMDDDRFRAKFYVNGTYLGKTEKGFLMVNKDFYWDNVKFDIDTDKEEYLSSENVTLHLNVTSSLDFDFNSMYMVRAFDSERTEIWNTTEELHLPPNSGQNRTFTFNLSTSAIDRNYQAFIDHYRCKRAHEWFWVKRYMVRLNASVPDELTPDTNETIEINVINFGEQDVRNGFLTLTFNDPEGVTLWNETKGLPLLPAGQNQTLSFTLPLGDVSLGGHVIAYQFSFDPGKTVRGFIDVDSSLVIEPRFDESYYRARDTVNLTLHVVNDGEFLQNRSIRVVAPDIGFNETRHVEIPLGGETDVAYNMSVPDDVAPGRHDALILVEEAGNWTQTAYSFVIPESRASASLVAKPYSAGEDVDVDLRNIGGVDTNLTGRVTLWSGRNGEILFRENFTETIQAGGLWRKSISTTGQLPTGRYLVQVESTNLRTSASRSFMLTLWLEGVEASLSVETEREVYLSTESIQALSRIVNGNRSIADGNLSLLIYSHAAESVESNWTTYYYPLSFTAKEIEFDDLGRMWIGTYGHGVFMIDGDEWTRYTTADGLPSNRITTLSVGDDGRVWVGSNYPSAEGLSVFNGTGWTRYDESNSGLLSDMVTGLALHPDGSVWAGSRTGPGVVRFDGANWTAYNTSNSDIGGNEIGCIEVDADGDVWLGGGSWEEFGVSVFNGTHWVTYNTANSDIIKNRVDTIDFDENGTAWIGHDVYLGGVSVFNGSTWETYKKSDGLSDYKVVDIDIDPDGNAWVATEWGLNVYNGTHWVSFLEADSGLESNDVSAVESDSTGTVWIGYDSGASGINTFNGSHWGKLIPDVIGTDIQGMVVDDEGSVWIATMKGVSRYNDAGWTHFTEKNSGIDSSDVRSVAIDNEGNLWFSTIEGLNRFDGASWTTYNETNTGHDFGYMVSMAADPYGNVWFASTYLKLYRFNGTDWSMYNDTNSGLASNVISSLTVDASGDLWVSTDSGLSRYNGTHWETFTEANSDLGNDDVISTAVDSSNSLWIAHSSGVDVYDGSTWTAYEYAVFDEIGVYPSRFTSISINDDDEVWLGTGRWIGFTAMGFGAVEYDGATWRVYNLTNSGIASLHIRGGIVFRDGDTWFGTSGGVSVLSSSTEGGTPTQWVWNANFTVNVPENATETSDHSVGIIGVTGKLYLKGELRTSEGRLIDRDVHPFYIVDGDVSLVFDLDKAVYKPGETLQVSGEARNLNPSQPVNGLTLTFTDNSTQVHQEAFDLSANGTHPFAFNSTAGSPGRHFIDAALTQGPTSLMTLRDQYDIVEPSVTVNVTAPDIVGWQSFSIDVLMNNTGDVEASVTVNSTTTETMAPGVVALVQIPQQIEASTEYTLGFSGDYEGEASFNVSLGASAVISLTPQGRYPEGLVSVPYVVNSTGTVDGVFNVTFTLDGGPSEQLEVHLPPGESTGGVLVYNLTQGDHTVGYSAVCGSGETVFSVVRRDYLNMSVSPPQRVNGSLMFLVAVSNLGANNFSGELRFITEFHENEYALDLPVDGIWNETVEVPLSGASPGAHNLTVQVITSGSTLLEGSVGFTVTAPDLRLTETPVNASFQADDLAILNFTVSNLGDEEGEAYIALDVPGIYDASEAFLVGPGNETRFNFTFPIPDDLEEGDYRVYYNLNGAINETSIFVLGAKIAVNASLDRALYEEGDTANLSIRVENLRGMNLTLFLTVASGVNESVEYLNLTGYGLEYVNFGVPVQFGNLTRARVQYSVYMQGGRSLHINSLNLNRRPPAGSGIELHTDKQVYSIGETVTVHVNASSAGFFNASSWGFEASGTIDGAVTYNFTVPELLSGTYFIDYTFENYTSMYPYDVDGYHARITRISLDRDEYGVGEEIQMAVTVEANSDFTGVLWTTIYDQYMAVIDRHSLNVNLTEGDNVIEVTRTIPIGGEGIYAINPRLYVDLPEHSLVLLTSGSNMFDVTEDEVPPVVSISSPVSVEYGEDAVDLNYTVNEPISWMGYSLDSASNVTLTGDTTLTGLSTGAYSLTVYATDLSNNTGSDAVSFSILLASPPPPSPPPPPPMLPPPPENTPPSAVTLDAPSEVTRDSMRLTWTESLEADFLRYEIYWSTGGDHPYTLVAEVDDSTVTEYMVMDMGFNTTYYFMVRVVDSGLLYDDSKTVSGLIFYDDPPEVDHHPVEEGLEGQEIEVSADVTDDLGPLQVFLHYRRPGDPGFTTVEMEPLDGRYSAVIPAEEVTTSTVEYYIEATDGASVVTDPAVDPQTAPHTVAVEMYPEPVSLDEPEENVTDSIGLSWTESPEPDFEAYEIYFSEEEGSLGTKIHEVTDRSTTYYNATGLDPGATYYFTVVVKDSSDLVRASNAVQVETPTPDVEPPVIVHFPVTDGIEETPIEIWTSVSDDTGVAAVTLYYRNSPGAGFVAVEMEVCEGCIDAYKGTIPGGAVVTPVVEYYIVAGDGVNAASYPGESPEEHPLAVDVNLNPSEVSLAEPSRGDVKRDSVLLTWTESPDDDFAVYSVYVSEEEGSTGEWVLNVTVRASASAEVTDLSPDTDYYFAVRVSDTGGLSSYSNQVAVRTKPRFDTRPLLVGLAMIVAAFAAVVLAHRRGLLGSQRDPDGLSVSRR